MLKYYDMNTEVTIQRDASEKGLIVFVNVSCALPTPWFYVSQACVLNVKMDYTCSVLENAVVVL